jgi:hypothetical protein
MATLAKETRLTNPLANRAPSDYGETSSTRGEKSIKKALPGRAILKD